MDEASETTLKNILITLTEALRDDIKRRSFDESGEQRAETLERVDALTKVIQQIKYGRVRIN